MKFPWSLILKEINTSLEMPLGPKHIKIQIDVEKFLGPAILRIFLHEHMISKSRVPKGLSFSLFKTL